MTTTTTVHFKICPKWLTGFVRDVWAEGSYQKSFNIINAAFPEMRDEIKFAIISGSKKLVQDKHDKESMNIANDDWKPDLSRCHNGLYPDPEEVRNNAVYTARDLEEYLERKNPTPPKLDRAEFIENNDLPDLKEVRREMKMFAGYDSLEEMNQALLFKRSIPTPEHYVETQMSRDERAGQKPKPDKTLLADLGWITPDGKFYACLTAMEHVWLADQFGLSEREAELAGWIKITRGIDMVRHVFQGEKEPTQKQIDTVFQWCEKHKTKLPDWAGGDL
jgi:hypothetical protein